MERIGRMVSKRQLTPQKQAKQRLESGFAEIGLGRDVKSSSMQGRCFWVPASVRHEVTSLQEAMVALYNDSVLDYALEKKDQVFNMDIDSKLVRLYNLLRKLDRDKDAADIIYTEEWRVIRELANDLYYLIENSEVAKNWHPDDLKG